MPRAGFSAPAPGRQFGDGLSPSRTRSVQSSGKNSEPSDSVTGVVATLCALSLALGLGVALALRADVPQPILLALFGALTLAYFLFTRHPDRAIAVYAKLTGKARRQEG